jgi:BMFP domain-containing protein YqiC
MTEHRPIPDALKDLADRIAEALSTVRPGAAPDVRARVESVVESALARLDLVPRDEYERALAALARLETELGRVEARLTALESAHADRGPTLD